MYTVHLRKSAKLGAQSAALTESFIEGLGVMTTVARGCGVWLLAHRKRGGMSWQGLGMSLRVRGMREHGVGGKADSGRPLRGREGEAGQASQ